MSSDEQNDDSGRDGIPADGNFSIKFSSTSTTQSILIKRASPSGNLKHDLDQNSEINKDVTRVNTKYQTFNSETPSKQNTQTRRAKSYKTRTTSSRSSPEISGQYDEEFYEKPADLSKSENVITTTFQNVEEDIVLLLTESDDDIFTKSNEESLVQQASTDSSKAEVSSNVTFSFRTLGNRHKLILISICMCNFLAYLCLSLIAPFFPEEAASKNVSDTVSGWIFGIFAFTQFLLAPVFGRLIPYTGVKFLYCGGLFTAAGCTVLFGCLTYIDTSSENITFIIYCFVLRIILALGCCALQTSSFTLTAKEFPDNVATVFGTTEVFVGIGFMSGPPIGGFLYGSGGFFMPFAVVGAVMFLGVPFNIWLIPSDTEIEKPAKSKKSVLYMLRSTKTLVNSLAVVTSAMIYSILDPTLEPHLSDTFQLNAEMIGLLFLLMAACYAISSPIVGSIADKLTDNRAILIPAFMFGAAGMLFLGPSELTGLKGYDQLWLNIVCLIVLGISSSAALIPTFDIYIDIAEEIGFEEDMGMYGMVAGMWGSMYAFGDFLGPTMGGFLLDKYGFSLCCTVTAVACSFMVVLLIVSWLYDTRCCTQKSWTTDQSVSITIDEKSPLLKDSQDNYEHDVLSTYPPYQAVSSQ